MHRTRWLVVAVAAIVVLAVVAAVVLTHRPSAPEADPAVTTDRLSSAAPGTSDAAAPPATDAAADSDAAADTATAPDTAADPPTASATGTTTATVLDIDEAVARGVQSAEDRGISQAIAVLDRDTGRIVASSQGDSGFDTMSVTKLFTAAYYLAQSDGDPGPELTDQLQEMITASDDDIQNDLWNFDIVGSVADRYGLPDTYGSGSYSPDNWGSDMTTADDMVTFLSLMADDPLVGPYLMDWMGDADPTGLDEFNQAFGLNALTGDHGSKQGWSDDGYFPLILNSVGWTGHYFVAILQRSDESFAAMRAASTKTAKLIAQSE